MVDVLTPEQRYHNMSRIRSKDTIPEMVIRKSLYSQGIRGYRTNFKLLGKPDIVFVKRRIAIFIDGCFWHKCPICFKEPETRKEFWNNKINKNVERDRIVEKELTSQGWKVMRFWEHDVRKSPGKVVNKIIKILNN